MGDIVCLLVRDETTPPTNWPIAHVIEIHTSKDGRVRVVTVRTLKGVYKRPIIKVVQLMSDQDGS